MMDTLVQNATLVNSGRNQEEPSPCERLCRKQQDALVSCVNSIRDYNEKIHAIQESSPEASQPKDDSTTLSDQEVKVKQCLAPAVSEWTQCCSKANTENP